MKNWQKFLIPSLFVLVIGSNYMLSRGEFAHNSAHIVKVDATVNANQDQKLDNLAVMRAYFPQYFEDAQRLENTTVWMKDGYAIPYFAYNGDHVDFSNKVGLIPSNQQLDVKKLVKAVEPAGMEDGVARGAQQVLAVFSMPGSEGLYALPIGAVAGQQEAYYSDQLFFYDDPHTIYDHWSKDVWKAIDAHQVLPGMSELQTRMAIGQNAQPLSLNAGDRTVAYDQAGKHLTVRFENNRATSIQDETAMVAKVE